MNKSPDVMYLLRLPPDVKLALMKLAAKNYRSLKAEINKALAEYIKAQKE